MSVSVHQNMPDSFPFERLIDPRFSVAYTAFAHSPRGLGESQTQEQSQISHLPNYEAAYQVSICMRRWNSVADVNPHVVPESEAGES